MGRPGTLAVPLRVRDPPASGVPEVGREEREIVGGQLVLQCLGGGGDNGRAPGQDGRDEVGQGLPGAGGRLHHELATAIDDVGHGIGHLELPRAGLAPAG